MANWIDTVFTFIPIMILLIVLLYAKKVWKKD